MKVLVCPDSFKNSLSAFEVAECIKIGIQKVKPDFEIVKIPLSDGGEGTLEIIMSLKKGQWIEKAVFDPLERKIMGHYGIIDDETAIIEMAKVSGLECLKQSERNPMLTSTWGVGELIKDALDYGCKRIIITLGGSATNDGGLGMAKALGYKFYDAHQEPLKGMGKDLINLSTIDKSNIDQRIYNCTFEVLCDVDNPLYGANGAAYVYAKQKGATDKMVQNLDAGLINFSRIIEKSFNRDVSKIPGAGAAGGLAAGLMAFLNGQLFPGFDKIYEILDLDKQLKACDVIITGEGFLDAQTLNGKVVYGVARKGIIYNKPVIAIVGGYTLDENLINKIGVHGVFSVINEVMDMNKALDKKGAKKRIISTTAQLMGMMGSMYN